MRRTDPPSALLVAPEADLARQLEAALTEAGYEVLGPVASPPEIARLASARSPAIVLVGLQRGGELDCVLAAERLRAQTDVLVVYVSGPIARADLDRALEVAHYARQKSPVPPLLQPSGEPVATTGVAAVALGAAFTATVAHHLNNPLFSIIVNADFLDGGLRWVDEQVGAGGSGPDVIARLRALRETLDDIRKAAERMRDVVASIGTLPGTELPAAPRKSGISAAIPAAPPPSPMQASGPTAAPRRARLLLVDDEQIVLNALRRILEEDYEITSTTDPQQALALLRQAPDFDLVLCDMMMPGLTGAELHDAVAGFSPRLADRMVFATGSTTTPQTRGFLSRVPNLRIEKPIRPAALRELVAAMLAVHASR